MIFCKLDCYNKKVRIKIENAIKMNNIMCMSVRNKYNSMHTKRLSRQSKVIALYLNI